MATKTTYSYTIATQITSGDCDVGYLHEEIETSSLPNFLGASTRNGAVEVIFSESLSEEDKTALDTVIQDHDFASAPPLMASFLTEEQKDVDIRTIDYNSALTTRLHKVVETMYRGEVREVNYYTDETLSALVLGVRMCNSEECTDLGYVRNSLGQPLERWTERTWYRANGTVFIKKVTHKIYYHDPVSQMREGLRRRTNVIDKMSVDILRSLVFSTAVNPLAPTDQEMANAYGIITPYFDRYVSGVSTFIRTGLNAFLTPPASPNITEDTDTWLDYSVTGMGYPVDWTIRTIILDSIQNIL